MAYGALGSPVIALAAVTGLDLHVLSGMIGRQLPFFSLLVPFWLIWAFVGFRKMMEVWPAVLVAGVSFALPQFLVSNFHGPWLVDVVAGIVSMVCLALFLRVWHPSNVMTEAPRDWSSPAVDERLPQRWRAQATPPAALATGLSRQEVTKAWMPWVILSVFVFLWGIPQVKAALDAIRAPKLPVAGLHNLVQKVPPVVAKAACGGGGLQPQSPLGDRHRHSACGHHRWLPARLHPSRDRANVRAHAVSRSLLDDHDRLHVGARVRRPATPGRTRR